MNNSAEDKDINNVPKRRKLSTLNYIHKKDFKESHDSDIKIVAFNREWNLHKIILSQSPCFNSMFSGSWKEKTLKEINLGIEDGNITAEAVHKVFESLYSGEIEIEPTEAVPLLACASFFQLDDLINHCAEVMKSCINTDNAVLLFEVAELYSIGEVKNLAFDLLCRNVWYLYDVSPKPLNMISEDLMKKLLTSPDLCVGRELDAFFILTTWVFMKENNFNFSFASVQDSIQSHLLQHFERYVKAKPFLETDSGISYQSLYRALRLKNLILDFEDIDKYNIIPMEWMMPIFKTQWYHMSRIHWGLDKGPKSVSEDIFNKECVRLSGYIKQRTEVWRYNYFDFGFGLTFSHNIDRFKIKRILNTEINSNNTVMPNRNELLNGFSSNRNKLPNGSSSNRNERYIMYRVSLCSLKDGRVLSKVESDINTVLMAPNDEIDVLTCKPLFNCLFQYRINFLLTTP